MTVATLSDIAIIHAGGRLGLTGKNFTSHGVPAFGAGGQNGLVNIVEYRAEGIILSSIGARCGKCFYASGSWTTLANTQVILPDLSRVDARFLWYQLNDEQRWPRSGTAQPFIKPSDVKTHRVYLPNLAEQRRIAAILDQASRLSARRQRAIALLDDLIPAVFNELFEGRNASYEMVTFKELLEDSQLGLVRSSREQGPDLPYEYLKMNSITRTGQLERSALTRVSATKDEASRYSLREGDLVFNTRNTSDLVGKSAIFHGSACLFNNNLMRLRFNAAVNSAYVHAFLWSRPGRRQLEAIKSGTTNVFAIYAKDLYDLKVPLPPARSQATFAAHDAYVKEQRARLLTSLAQINELHKALQARAFIGQL